MKLLKLTKRERMMEPILIVGGILIRLGWVRMEKKRQKCNGCNKILVWWKKYGIFHLNRDVM